MTVGRRSHSNIDRHVENCAHDATNELALWVGLGLKMHTAQHAARSRENVVVLDELNDVPLFRENVSPVERNSSVSASSIVYSPRSGPTWTCFGSK